MRRYPTQSRRSGQRGRGRRGWRGAGPGAARGGRAAVVRDEAVLGLAARSPPGPPPIATPQACRPVSTVSSSAGEARLNHGSSGDMLCQASAVQACAPGLARGKLSAKLDDNRWSCRAVGVLATLSRWRSRVQVPSGPPRFKPCASSPRSGSSVGTSVRLKSGRSTVRSCP
jgi:hypothetical protein